MKLEPLLENSLIQALEIALLLSAVPLLASMVIGLVISVLQAATQIQEQTLPFVFKMSGVCLLAYFFGGSAWNLVYGFSHEQFLLGIVQ